MQVVECEISKVVAAGGDEVLLLRRQYQNRFATFLEGANVGEVLAKPTRRTAKHLGRDRREVARRDAVAERARTIELTPRDERRVVALTAKSVAEVLEVVEARQQEPRSEAVLLADELPSVGRAAPDQDSPVVFGPQLNDAGCGIPPPEPLVLSELFGDDFGVLSHLARGPRGLRAGLLRLARLEHFHRKREVASLARVDRADADNLARHFLALVIANGHEDGVLPRLPVIRVFERALEPKRGKAGSGARRCARLEAEMLLTSRAAGGALENYRAAVGAESRRPRCRRSNCAHDARLVVPSVSPGRDWPSSPHPNSARPRMREPAAKLTVPALRSPVSTPESSNSTRWALSMFPSISPLMITVLARTLPVSLAPGSIVRSP